MGCYHQQCCNEAMQLYKGKIGRMMDISEMDPTHPPGCHVMHATGEWHFNTASGSFDPDLIVKGVHQICKAVKGLLDESP